MSLDNKRAAFSALVAKFNGWQKIPFSELLSWINNDSAVARLITIDPLNPVKPRTVTAWRFRERVPSKHFAAILYVLSDGELTPNALFSDEITRIINAEGWL